MKKGRGHRGDYKIGKGRPPKEYQFKPGQSGNRSGRPKGSKNAATMARAALNRKVVVTINGIKKKMTVRDISFRRLGDNAMTGDLKALNCLLALENNTNPADIDTAAESITPEQDREIIADYMRRQKQKGSKK